MLERTQCKSSGSPKYDPQVGAAAAANAALAQRSQQFSEDFTNTYIAPLLQQMTQSTAEAQKNENDLFALNIDQTKTAAERYKQYGIPAEDRYYKMVDEYSDKSTGNKMATEALGDVRTAEASQQGTFSRRLSGLGINMNSPAAVSAMADMAVQNAATEAAAATRARGAAKTLGMQLKSDAANFGRGGQSGILQFGAAASGNTVAGAQVGQSSVGAAAGGAGVNQAGYGLGIKAYGSNLDAYTGLAKADAQQRAQSAGGIGQLVGTLGSAFLMSDRRMKREIAKLAIMPNGLTLYTYALKTDPKGMVRTGFMADEVEKVRPEAVITASDGYKRVNYAKAVL